MISSTNASQSENTNILTRTLRLQTVSAEASQLIRDQSIQVMQSQSIRLEDMADTEIETLEGIEQCMGELMHCVLYTELRRDIRQVCDSLEELQLMLMNTSQHSNTGNGVLVSGGENSEHKGKVAVEDGFDEEEEVPTQLSTADTFRTARDVPIFSDCEETQNPPITSATSSSDPLNGQSQSSDENNNPLTLLSKLELQLYQVCVEIDEWRRTRCVKEFIAGIVSSGKNGTGVVGRSVRSPSIRSTKSARLPVERILFEARARASSLGHTDVFGGLSSTLDESIVGKGKGKDAIAVASYSTSPPLSRLMQVEREVDTRRTTTHHNKPHRAWSSSSPTTTPSTSLHPADITNTDAVSVPHFNSLRLLEPSTLKSQPATISDTSNPTSITSQRNYQTIADDVRIIGWVTRGSGLDVHTEFKILLHLTRGENMTVLRRYTDFSELRVVLCERFHAFRKRIPQLPPKKAFGKFEDKFLKKRESGLQFFLAYVVLHPVIGCSSIIKSWLLGDNNQ